SFNANALICARLMDEQRIDALDVDFFQQRISQALALRHAIFPAPFYRLVYGEGDWLAGVVIDRFDQHFVVQISTHAIEDARAALIQALQQIFGSQISIVFKNDGKGRQIEGLPSYVETIGTPVQHLAVIENGVPFTAPLDGQKTGWFYDHRGGRQWLNQIAAGKRVLDLFSYIGGWGVQAAAHGASAVTCIDVSAKAGEYVQINAQHNQLTQVEFIESDIFDWLKQPSTSASYDVVVLDPPALIQKRRDFEQGRQAYFKLNEGALAQVKDGGILVSASCSLHLHRDELLKIIQQVARRQNKRVQLIHEAHPLADHPQLLAMSESAYLKCLMFSVSTLPSAQPYGAA
ncbi:MAG: class I SAM-dependent rRNA methyltransferase, partial [Pseudomonadota bacterium]|nr:class I SAM-dependent rRNA methyltransferase [Pseudomonadota bacterium]